MATTHQESSNSLSLLSGVYRKTRTFFLTAVIVGLVATNVASLISDALHNSLYGGLSRLVNALPSFHSKNKLLQKSPTSVRQAGVRKATGKLRAENSALIKKNTDLTQRHNKLVHRYNGLAKTNTSLVNRYNGLAKNHNMLRKQHLATRKSFDDLNKITRVRAEKLQTFSANMSNRSAKIAAANVAALPAEFAPVVGTAAIVSLTLYDLHLLCEGMQELNSARQTFGFSKEDETRVCGIKVPTKEAVQKEVADNYHGAVAKAKEYISW